MPNPPHHIRHPRGLRARTTLGFAVVAATVTGVLALVSYQRISTDVVQQREQVAVNQAYANARILRTRLAAPDPVPREVVASLQSRQGTPVLRFAGEWSSASVDVGRDALPEDLRRVVQEGQVARQRATIGGDLVVVVGVPVLAVGAEYFEVIPLADVEQTLAAVRQSLGIGTVAATLLSGAIGAFVSGTVLRPIRRVAGAAQTVRQGDLTTQVELTGDPDLDPLVTSFNEMVADVRQRIDRDVRFASDVTHELQGPLAALSAATEHARRHADDPEAVRTSLDVLARTVDHFSSLVVDLLEMSRIEAGVASLNAEPVQVGPLVDAVVATSGQDVPITIADDVPHLVHLDKRRIGQCLANLLQNAERYAGGATAVRVEVADDRLRFLVDDDGPGVPPHERTYVFERFARGDRGQEVSGGTGLGLALVAEHLRLHDGRALVVDSPSGGARFVLELPLVTGP